MTTTEPAPNAGHEISGPLPVESRRPSLSDLASAAKADRNRAIDFYRVAAMAAVAIGHWMAVAVGVDADGKLIAGNALQSRPGLGILTWFFQVMPLFFVVGGFSSAMSLDSHAANSNSANSNGANSNGANSNAAGGGRPQDWVVARLRRMVSPAMVLATTWLGLLGFAALIDSAMGNGIRSGLTPLIAVGAVGAAIPLWFLANYTIDTAIAPYVLPLFRRQPALVAAGGATVFLALEGVRLADLSGPLHYLPYLNWVLGWLLFQVMGFAWRDGLLPTGRTLVALTGALWAAAVAAVAFGPWPVSMVHFPGIAHSPTQPPSLALMLFGAAYSCTAVALAPAVSRALAANRRAWSAVVAANSVALSVYLWHLSAAVIAAAIFYSAGWLPTAAVGTGTWWLQKAPLMAASALILALIVTVVSVVERRALLAPRTSWKGGQASMLSTACGLSLGVKLWANPNITSVVIGMSVVTGLWFAQLRDVRSPELELAS